MQKNHSLFTKASITALTTLLFLGTAFVAQANAVDSPPRVKPKDDVELPSAKDVEARVTLQAGGRTLGGPGIAFVSPGNSVNVIKLPSTHERFMCVTGHNQGPGTASLRVKTSPSGPFMNKLLRPKQSRSVCGLGTLATISCQVKKCTVDWRVDDAS